MQLLVCKLYNCPVLLTSLIRKTSLSIYWRVYKFQWLVEYYGTHSVTVIISSGTHLALMGVKALLVNKIVFRWKINHVTFENHFCSPGNIFCINTEGIIYHWCNSEQPCFSGKSWLSRQQTQHEMHVKALFSPLNHAYLVALECA